MVTSLQPGPWPGQSDNNAIIIVTIVWSLDYSNICMLYAVMLYMYYFLSSHNNFPFVNWANVPVEKITL